MTTLALADRKTAVYRLYDVEDVLLYVGVSWDPASRIPHHEEKTWWYRVAKSDVEWHPFRDAALYYEAEAIRDERPLFNIIRADPERILDRWRREHSAA